MRAWISTKNSNAQLLNRILAWKDAQSQMDKENSNQDSFHGITMTKVTIDGAQTGIKTVGAVDLRMNKV